ncbi:hypothetical protein BX600DRAFT_464801 [Xylariales sp. PMI_506]|nr:hypothetical protein BX600DRAFT_464801 [Xylariales sp. PMI_506]
MRTVTMTMKSPATRPTLLEGLPDELLQHVLDYVMVHDSPFYIDYDTRPQEGAFHGGYWPPSSLSLAPNHPGTSTANRASGCNNPHVDESQHAHRTDWVAINSTCRRIRRLGKPSFFRSKTICLETSTVAKLNSGTLSSFMFSKDDQAAAMTWIRELIILDGRTHAPAWWLGLPCVLALLPRLRSCTIIFGLLWGSRLAVSDGAIDMSHFIPTELQDMLTGIGVSRSLVLKEGAPSDLKWEDIHRDISRNIYPILKIRAQARSRSIGTAK